MTLPMPPGVTAIAEALLIGFLIGAQREASQGEGHPGVRDFVLIALIGAVCGLLGNAWLAAAALVSVTALLGFFYLRGHERSGITTETAAVATYCLGFLATTPQSRLSVGIAIVVVAFLEAKRSLHKLVRETITETEFNDTLRFLAIIFIVYPILPEGQFGPYQFLAPRTIWLFVILVSSVSYAGYFFGKFLGVRRGLKLAAVLGGFASTTAATAAFARSSVEEPASGSLYSQAAVIANSIQFPRLLLILAMVSPALAGAVWRPMVGMTAAGLLVGILMRRWRAPQTGAPSVTMHNPFRLGPALKFGVLFAVILFATKAAASVFGNGAVYWTAAFGGSLDVDAVSLSMADLLGRGAVGAPLGAAGVLLALLANAVVKTGIAVWAGSRQYAWSVAAGFAAMLAMGAALWLL